MSPTDGSVLRPKLLLIDDDPISREVLSMLLAMHGYPVACAEGGEEALAGIETESPEIILMDTQMPGLSGLALIEALRAKTSSRIVAISGSEVGESIRLATDGFLLKPLQPMDLDALLMAQASATPPAKKERSEPEENRLPTDPFEESLIEPQVLNKLLTIMPATAVREIYEAVAADLTLRLAALANAMQADDAPGVARIAHTIKGGCSMVGVTIAIEAAAKLEFSNRNGTWSHELAQLHSALDRLERILGGEFPT
jgi:CheY-like chemotaxis protein